MAKWQWTEVGFTGRSPDSGELDALNEVLSAIDSDAPEVTTTGMCANWRGPRHYVGTICNLLHALGFPCRGRQTDERYSDRIDACGWTYSVPSVARFLGGLDLEARTAIERVVAEGRLSLSGDGAHQVDVTLDGGATERAVASGTSASDFLKRQGDAFALVSANAKLAEARAALRLPLTSDRPRGMEFWWTLLVRAARAEDDVFWREQAHRARMELIRAGVRPDELEVEVEDEIRLLRAGGESQA